MKHNFLVRVSFTVLVIVFALLLTGWTGNAAPILAAPNGGAWTGTTNRGYPMSFTVSPSGTQWSSFSLTADFNVGFCAGTLTIDVPTTGAVTNNQFSGSAFGPTGTFSFTGQFTSPSAASGTYSFTDYGIFGCGFFFFFNQSGTWTAQGPAGSPTPTFTDVPFSYWSHDYIERLYNAGITGGCSTNPLAYCPEQSVTRAQMAVFLEKGMNGSSFSPPNVAPTFGDTIGHWAEDWIEALKKDGVTSGCGTGKYCPESQVTRAQMAVFLLKAKYGKSYTPPAVGASTGFSDVPTTYWAAAWIKRLAAEGITSGCGTGIYCPESSVTRAQMAVFLTKTFGLP